MLQVQAVIEDKLMSAFNLLHQEVTNESQVHNFEPNEQNYFKVVLVSNDFSGLRVSARHRLVRAVLSDELAEQIFGLALHTYTENEWDEYYFDRRNLSPTVLAGARCY